MEVNLRGQQHSATLGYPQGEGFENLHGEDEAAKHCPILAPPAAAAEEALLAEAAGATAGLFLLLLRRRVARRILRGLWKGLSSEGNTIGIVCLTRLTVEWRASSLDSESDKWVRARQSPISLFEVLTKIFSSRHRWKTGISTASPMIARPLYPLLIRPCPREVFPGTDFRVCKDLSLVSPIPCFGPAAHSLPLLLSLPFESGSGQRLRGKRRNERDGESRAPSPPRLRLQSGRPALPRHSKSFLSERHQSLFFLSEFFRARSMATE